MNLTECNMDQDVIRPILESKMRAVKDSYERHISPIQHNVGACTMSMVLAARRAHEAVCDGVRKDILELENKYGMGEMYCAIRFCYGQDESYRELMEKYCGLA